jgi:hypothetical protein
LPALPERHPDISAFPEEKLFSHLRFTYFMVTANKTVSGYHLLMILSYVDGHFDVKESRVAEKYVMKHFGDDIQPGKEIQFLKTLKEQDYFSHFKKCMDNFYSKSSIHERADIVRFAMEMIKADRKITPEENRYLNELLTGWEPEHTG